MDFKMYISMFFSVLIIIVFVVLIFYGGKWLTKRYSISTGNRQIKIIDRIMLGQDKSIVIAEIINCKYIIGITGHQITLIKDLGDIELPDMKTGGQEDFALVLSGLLKKPIDEAKDWLSSRGGKK